MSTARVTIGRNLPAERQEDIHFLRAREVFFAHTSQSPGKVLEDLLESHCLTQTNLSRALHALPCGT